MTRESHPGIVHALLSPEEPGPFRVLNPLAEHPILLVCEEAHQYIPSEAGDRQHAGSRRCAIQSASAFSVRLAKRSMNAVETRPRTKSSSARIRCTVWPMAPRCTGMWAAWAIICAWASNSAQE